MYSTTADKWMLVTIQRRRRQFKFLLFPHLTVAEWKKNGSDQVTRALAVWRPSCVGANKCKWIVIVCLLELHLQSCFFPTLHWKRVVGVWKADLLYIYILNIMNLLAHGEHRTVNAELLLALSADYPVVECNLQNVKRKLCSGDLQNERFKQSVGWFVWPLCCAPAAQRLLQPVSFSH